MAFGLETAFDEKRLLVSRYFLCTFPRGCTVHYWYAQPLFPEEYPTLPQFEAAVVERFNASFYHVYGMVKALDTAH